MSALRYPAGNQAHRPFPHTLYGLAKPARGAIERAVTRHPQGAAREAARPPRGSERADKGHWPCIPPHILGPMVERILLRARVARNEEVEAAGLRPMSIPVPPPPFSGRLFLSASARREVDSFLETMAAGLPGNATYSLDSFLRRARLRNLLNCQEETGASERVLVRVLNDAADRWLETPKGRRFRVTRSGQPGDQFFSFEFQKGEGSPW